MEILEIPAFRFRVFSHGPHDRVIIEFFECPFGHDIVVVAHKTTTAESVHLIIGAKTARKKVGVTFGGVRLFELERAVISRRSFAAKTHRE